MAVVAYGGMLNAGDIFNPEEELVRAGDIALEVNVVIILEMGRW
jgi:hypothetical protein